MDALVLTGEPLPLAGGVTTGAGLRAWGLCQGLRCAGLDAWVATRREALAGDVDEEAAKREHVLLWSPETVASQIEHWNPACVVSQHWGLLSEVPPIERPLAIDLAGPHLLERKLWGAENWAEHLEEKLAALRRADFVVCSGERQRLYFLNHIAMAGFEVESDPLPVIPFSVNPDLPTPDPTPGDLVYGGMFLPWQDPRVGLETTVRTLEKEGSGHLHFWGGPHPRLDVSRGRFEDLLKTLENSERVTCHSLSGFDAYCHELTKCAAALDVMARNPERELAYATRTVLYLWAGLPVIHGDFDELAPLIAAADAGWIVRPDDAVGIQAAVREVIHQPELAAERGRNAQRLVRERLTWDKTIEPLAAWCREPVRREGKLALSLQFESKDREIRSLRAECDQLQSEVDTIRGKLSWRVAQGLLALHWLWAVLIWLTMLPICIVLGIVHQVADLLPRRSDAREFPPPPKPNSRNDA